MRGGERGRSGERLPAAGWSVEMATVRGGTGKSCLSASCENRPIPGLLSQTAPHRSYSHYFTRTGRVPRPLPHNGRLGHTLSPAPSPLAVSNWNPANQVRGLPAGQGYLLDGHERD